jgi:hypothetical protein
MELFLDCYCLVDCIFFIYFLNLSQIICVIILLEKVGFFKLRDFVILGIKKI